MASFVFRLWVAVADYERATAPRDLSVAVFKRATAPRDLSVALSNYATGKPIDTKKATTTRAVAFIYSTIFI